MTIQLIMDNVNIPVKHIQFSDGGTNLQLIPSEDLLPKRYISITVDPTTPVDRYNIEISQTLYAFTELYEGKGGDAKVIINLPYLPNGRADRVFEKGNLCPLELFFDTLGAHSEKYEIHLTDPHSDFYKEYGDLFSFVVKPQWDCFLEVAGKDIKSGDVLISPDKGALSKIYLLQDALKLRKIDVEVVEAGKKRDISTGRIVETTLPEGVDLVGKTCFIVDDLSDYGNTFVGLAKKLKEAGAKGTNLYVTHMIAAGGLSNLVGVIDKLFVYQVVANYITMDDIQNFNLGKEVR